MKKRILATLLSLCLVIGLLSVTAMAAEVSGEMTGEAFLNAAESGSIVLTGNVTLTSTAEFTEGVYVVDLNGHTLTTSDATEAQKLFSAFQIGAGVDLTITDSEDRTGVLKTGTATNLSNYMNQVATISGTSDAKLTIRNAVVEGAKGVNTKYGGHAIYLSAGNSPQPLTIENSVVRGGDCEKRGITSDNYTGYTYKYQGEGGTALYLYNPGDVTISNSEITGGNGLSVECETKYISGGANFAEGREAITLYKNAATVIIENSTVTGGNSTLYNAGDALKANGTVLIENTTLKGGSCYNDVDNYGIAGAAIYQNGVVSITLKSSMAGGGDSAGSWIGCGFELSSSSKATISVEGSTVSGGTASNIAKGFGNAFYAPSSWNGPLPHDITLKNVELNASEKAYGDGNVIYNYNDQWSITASGTIDVSTGTLKNVAITPGADGVTLPDNLVGDTNNVTVTGAKATVTGGNTGSTSYYPSAETAAQNVQPGQTLTVTEPDVSIVVPAGVEVKNESGETITINGTEIESSTTPVSVCAITGKLYINGQPVYKADGTSMYTMSISGVNGTEIDYSGLTTWAEDLVKNDLDAANNPSKVEAEVYKDGGTWKPATTFGEERYVMVDVTTYYNVTFNTDGGSEIPAQTVKYGGTATEPTAPTKTGYTFGGWYTDAECTTKYDFSTAVTGNLTLYAKWTVNQYTITFDTDGGSEVASITQDYGTAITAPENPTKTGYTFAGWDKTIPDTMPAENLTIKAKWNINQYTITYDLDGGTVEGNPDGYTVETDTFTLNNPTKRGYIFTGWSGTGLTGENNLTVTIETGSTGDRNYTAHWRYNGSYIPTYPVTVESARHGDVSVTPKSASRGTTVTITVEPDDGYKLDTLTVTDGSGNVLKLTDKGNGKYTFTMPSSRVSVKASFVLVNPFVDVSSGAYYYDAVLWAVENGITEGTSATTFSPNAPCTRAQMVTFLWRAAGCPEPKSSVMPFTDVAVNAYYYDAVLWAVEQGITNGTSDTTFSPNDACTRAQIVTFLWRSQKSPASGSVNPFADVAADAYYADAVLWAVENGITYGTGKDTFSPGDDCTRGQIVTFLYRYFQN